MIKKEKNATHYKTHSSPGYEGENKGKGK